MAEIALGKKVPAFRAEATNGETIGTKELAGRAYVLYFYPRDNTPGCTREGEDFRDLHAKFKRRKVTVLGVSRDSLRSHERFKEKFSFPFELLADPDEKLCTLFGVMKDKNMYGKKVRGIERSSFLVDAAGVLRGEWRKVKVEGHAEAVLEAAKAL
jgi:thioredoxin-dependent peroxiredoxin